MTPQGLGDIIINGGTINAQGASWYTGYNPSGGTAGIGSSENSGVSIPRQPYADNRYINNITGSVTITGGTVNATGGNGAAGIGGGLVGTLKTITITGGTVSATGGSQAAAIGLGANRLITTGETLTCPQIAITGGTVTANGNIGYGHEITKGSNVGGKVTIGLNVTLKCTGSIAPFEAATIPANSYVDADGNMHQASTPSSVWGQENWNGGWWVVDQYTEVNGRINVTGTVNLILNDGVTLKAKKGIQVYKGNTLNIYTQMNGTGKIIATGSSGNAGIGGGFVEGKSGTSDDRSCGTINIYGGTIEASGNTGAGIGCGNIRAETTDGGTVNIYGGTVKASGDTGAGIGAGGIFEANKYTNLHTVNIYGGTVEASGNYGAGIGGGDYGSGGNITIQGGNVSAVSKWGTGIGYGRDAGSWNNNNATISLSWTNFTDKIYAKTNRNGLNFYAFGGTVSLQKQFMYENSTNSVQVDNSFKKNKEFTIVPPVSVSLNANGGSGTMNGITAACGFEYTLPECGFTPAEGMVFDKWQVGNDEIEVGGKITVKADTEVKALWKYGQRTVTFDLRGHGDGDAPDAKTVNYSSKLPEPPAPTASGYTFGGWYKESSCVNRWEFASETVTENRTLYAKWTANAYTISYNLAGGVNSANNPLSYTTTETFSLTEPTKTGYTFAGWTYDGHTTPIKNVTINGGTIDMTFTAHWTPNHYTITFDTEGGSTVAPVTYAYGDGVSAPDVTPTCKERIFMGWQNLPSTMPAENITVYAEWRWLYHYEAREATCMYEGMIDCYYWNGHYYTENSDGVTYTEIQGGESAVITPKTSHNYDNPEWTWSIDNYSGEWRANLKLTCTKDASHVIQTFADVTSEVTTAPTLTTEGVRTYTATEEVDAESCNTTETKTYTDTKEVVLPKTVVVAKIGETGYPSVKDAMDKAASGDIITVMDDVNELETACGGSPSYSGAFTLDLNGHSVTLASITMSASLTVKNGTLRCVIKNQNVGNDDALTLDYAEVYCEEGSKYDDEWKMWVPYNGLEWYARNIAVTNGSQLYIVGNTYLGGGDEDGFNLTIDGRSCVVLMEATLSGYNDARVRNQFAQYLPSGYSINTDYEDNIPDGRVMYDGSEYTGPVTLSPATIILADNADNRTAIDFNYGYEKNVKLDGRTLVRDGNWNTLCLPFIVTAEQIAETTHPLYGATIKEMASTSNLDTDGLLTLNFTTVYDGTAFADGFTQLEAGKPYIVKWDASQNLADITSPTFPDVTISSTTPTAVKSSDNKVSFVGQYSPFSIVASGATGSNQGNLNEIIMLGSGSTLGYSQNPRTLRCFRAHFYVPANDGTPTARRFVLDFSDGEETTGVVSMDNGKLIIDNSVYDLQGRRVESSIFNSQSSIMKKGVYIVNGKKTVVK